MGSLLSKFDDKMPEIYSYADYERVVTEVNLISIQISRKTKLVLNVLLDSLKLNYTNWKNSLLSATLGLFPRKQQKSLAEVEEEAEHVPQYTYQQKYDLNLTMRQLYDIFELLKYFKKQKVSGKSEITNTPSSIEQAKGCQICFDEAADLALPCGHIFGANCISKYIIDKELKSCPMCRREFMGRRSAIEKDLYIVIDEDKGIFEEVRSCLLAILSKNNEKATKSAKQALTMSVHKVES